MKLSKSSIECAEYNKNNQESISLGLLHSWEPNELILKEESEAVVQAKNKDEFRLLCGKFWELVISFLSENDQKVFSKEQKYTYLNADYTSLKVHGDIEVYKRRSWDDAGKIRIYVGSHEYARRGMGLRRKLLWYKPNNIQTLSADKDFAAKVAAEITERIKIKRGRVQIQNTENENSKKSAEIYNSIKNELSYLGVSEYQFKTYDQKTFSSSISFSGTPEQWAELARAIKEIRGF